MICNITYPLFTILNNCILIEIRIHHYQSHGYQDVNHQAT